MCNKINLINNLIDLINNTSNLEQHTFNEYITKNNIYFYEFISIAKNHKLVLKKIINMLKIDYSFFIKAIHIINKNFKITKHHIVYHHEYYLILILQLLNNHNQWITLKLNILANNPNKFHYKTIHKKFLLYTNYNIFKKVFYNTTINKPCINNNTDLLIDASMISNKLGSENVTVNCEYTKKNCTKLSFISNSDKILLSITPYDVNNKEIDYNEINQNKNDKDNLKKIKKDKIKELKKENKELKKKFKKMLKTGIIDVLDDKDNKKDIECKIDNIQIKNNKTSETNEIKETKIIKTSIHDVMMIQTSINNIKTKFNNLDNITLTGDLGYLTTKQHKINKKDILLITPKRKNQKSENIESVKIKLKSRYKIENCFSSIKQYERIILRKERKIRTFMSFIYIACAIENNKIIKKKTNL
jgi:hypothetical protein